MTRKITALQVQKRNPNRVNVFLDGEFAFGLARITAAWLKVGQDLSPEKIAKLQADDAGEAAIQRALRFISYRPRSTAEVAANLRKHETPEPIIEQVIGRLRETGTLNDEKFARLWVENRSELKPKGAYALQQELKQKGLGEAAIRQSLAGLDEAALALQAARQKAAKMRTSDEQEFKKKLYGFLGRRGFGYETITRVVQQVWNDRQAA
jgi:regulatory protein